MLCVICETRKPRRFCPGVNGEICTLCCGTEREVTVSCPLECEYLQEARRREPPPVVDQSAIPDQDIAISERYLRDHSVLLDVLASAVAGVALRIGAIDADVREALTALARTYRSLESGVVYDTRPAGSFASAIYDELQGAAREFRAAEHEKTGVTRTRDADMLAMIVFLKRAAIGWDNGRARGRSFVDWLRRHYGDSLGTVAADRSSLIVP